jgi:hypothetical protein
MMHQDTQHCHAHVLFFRDKRLDKETFLSWQTDVRAELARQEQQQLNDQSARQEMGLEAGQTRGQELAVSASSAQALRSAKGWEVGL